jgi:hypothetical protein
MPTSVTQIDSARALWLSLGVVVALAATAMPAFGADSVEFNRDIRPILADKCFTCHGPDQAQRKADLRLDIEQAAKREVDGKRPLAPGSSSQSEVYQRITSTDADVQMPPAESGKKLTPGEIDLIRRWIDQGAAWQQHWAFIPPTRPAVPAVRQADWPRNAVDRFILAKLEAEGLSPSPEADKSALVRRVTLDLTGLPPTPTQQEQFLADDSGDAYERLVDRLLASPRHGEHMAVRWLDAARYADTSGYQDDGIRYMWRWRDWVIEALNQNMPFDRFTIEQIAGDLLSGATLDQQIATGFNRNHRTNAEGGIIPEEYAVEYVVDRVETTATVWLGLTLGCARCHDHKFDPITQREFYQVFAFFNNVPEKGRAIKVGNSPPMIKAPTRDQQMQLAAMQQKLAQAQETLDAMQNEIASLEATWAETFKPAEPIGWAPGEPLLAHFPLDGNSEEAIGRKPPTVDGTSQFAQGKIGTAVDLDGATAINAGELANFGFFDKFTLSAWIKPRSDSGAIVAKLSDQSDADGYSLALAGGKLQINLVKRWLDDALRVETADPLEIDRWQHVAITYDGSRVAAGVKIYVDGRPRTMTVLLDELNQTFSTKEPLRIGGGGAGPRFKGLLDDVRIYKAALEPGEIALVATSDPIESILAIKPQERTASQAAKLRAYWLAHHAPGHVQAARHQIAELHKQIAAFEENFPTTMVMVEMPTPRQAHVLERGQYDKPAEPVQPDVPGRFPRLANGGRDRLALAHWLTDPANPLPARVAVNRFWQAYFGTGIVRTGDDFGAQGDAPSHPELLDWLATEFVAAGWDMKAMHRLIVTSAAYRQSSRVTPQLAERDPENRLLARGPRFRLRAEAIRDQALAASGLLVDEVGGPSVRPYQPPGLWKELTGGADFVQDHGRNLYRRSIYTFWKRTIAPPSMITFDASAREACSVRTNRTNTPLQALALLNEVTFVETARVLAERVMREASTPEERLTLLVRSTLSRGPSDEEMKILLSAVKRHQERFSHDGAAAEKLVTVGESPRDGQLNVAELAAYTTAANLILNLDELVTKE